jgi:hypothetical protein
MNSKTLNVKVKISQLHAKKSHRRALNILDPFARMGWVVSAKPRLLIYTQGRDSLSIHRRMGVIRASVDGSGKSLPTGFLAANFPACSE